MNFAQLQLTRFLSAQRVVRRVLALTPQFGQRHDLHLAGVVEVVVEGDQGLEQIPGQVRVVGGYLRSQKLSKKSKQGCVIRRPRMGKRSCSVTWT